jgi:hypothetical protein
MFRFIFASTELAVKGITAAPSGQRFRLCAPIGLTRCLSTDKTLVIARRESLDGGERYWNTRRQSLITPAVSHVRVQVTWQGTTFAD